MVEQHKRQQDAESLASQERSREIAERHAQDEVSTLDYYPFLFLSFFISLFSFSFFFCLYL